MGLFERILGRSGKYIPAAKTVADAERAGLSVCDHVERMWGMEGCTARIIDRMAVSGAFRDGARIVEIGTGTGRYLEKTLERCISASYHSYELDTGWARWLARTYPITSCPTDGASLASTEAADLIHAHGVFVYLPFLTTTRYFAEIWRVAAPGAVVAFDCFTEDCMTEAHVARWLASAHDFPCILPRDYVVGLFADHGFTLRDTFTSPYGEGESRYLVFVR